MKALVYHGPGQSAWESVPDPVIGAPTDAIVRITTSTICGTDLHILKGDVPEVPPGTILGHEAVGIVVETGAAVTTLAEGDRVLVSCITSCGRCRFCQEGRYGLCTGGGGWILGHTHRRRPGRVARIPFADTSRVQGARTAERRAGALPRRHPADRLRGRRPQRKRRRPATPSRSSGRPDRTGRDHGREAATRRAGSSRSTSPTRGWRRRSSSAPTSTIDNSREDAVARVHGADRRARRRRRDRGGRHPGRRSSSAPSSSAPAAASRTSASTARRATLHLERLWIKDVTITTGLVDTTTTPRLLQLIVDGRLDPTLFATHRFELGETEEAYEVFANAGANDALKVVLSAHPVHLEPGEAKELVAAFSGAEMKSSRCSRRWG